MYYYEVRIAGRSYHSKKPLTYACQKRLNQGTIVSVPVRNKLLRGFIVKSVSKPSFEAKEIDRVSDSAPLSEASLKLHDWIESYYPATASSTLQLFLPNKVLKRATTDSTHAATDDNSSGKNENPPTLRTEQTKALKTIRSSKASSFLLHGETGSGKTRVYAELAKEATSKGRSVLILTPEIGLTSQLVNQLQHLLKEEIIVLHSQLTAKQKRERWQLISKKQTPVVTVGPRSSLFAPFRSLGLIVVDEAHEDSYKQESAPHYHASRVAAQLSHIHQARLVLGTATPTATDYKIFQEKDLPIIKMSSNTADSQDFECSIVDIKDRNNFTSSQHLSKILVSKVELSLKNGEQSLIYLNRRGTARLVLCQNCGWESVCQNCDIPLTFHEDTHKLQCHTCGLVEKPPATCPSCKSSDIFYKQIGTKALIKHVQSLFPDAKIARFDTDAKKDQRLEARYEEIRSGEIDILVGTQLLGKGLDLPLLSTVGIIQADSSLTLPDFSAREKTYQQLHQIIGRVGRGHRSGHVVVQTYNPSSQLIKAATEKDYQAFLEQELQERKQFLFPPYCYLLKIVCSRANDESAQHAIHDVEDTIKALPIKAQLIGPSPAFKAKTHNKHHWQLIVKSKQRADLLKIIESLPAKASYDIDPINLL